MTESLNRTLLPPSLPLPTALSLSLSLSSADRQIFIMRKHAAKKAVQKNETHFVYIIVFGLSSKEM